MDFNKTDNIIRHTHRYSICFYGRLLVYICEIISVDCMDYLVQLNGVLSRSTYKLCGQVSFCHSRGQNVPVHFPSSKS